MPHIKEKNVNAAQKKADKLDVDELKKLTIEQVAGLALQVDATEKALKEQARIVKQHVHKVYGPLCAKKKELEIEYAFLVAKLEKVKEINPAIAAISKLAGL
jgi:hypothetical protein